MFAIVILAVLGVIAYRAKEHSDSLSKAQQQRKKPPLLADNNGKRPVTYKLPPWGSPREPGSVFILDNPNPNGIGGNSGGSAVVASGGPATVPFTGGGGASGTSGAGSSSVTGGSISRVGHFASSQQ